MKSYKLYNKKEEEKSFKEKMQEILKYKRVRYFGIAVILLIFTIALNIAFSSFMYRDTTAVANIKVAGMEYAMTIDSNPTRIVKGNANDVTIVEVEITAANKYASKYELIYKVCTTSSCSAYQAIPADFEVQYHEDTASAVTGEIGTTGTKTITIAIINDTASDVWIELGINAGYAHNTLAGLIVNEYVSFGPQKLPIALKTGMIPVAYDENGNTVKADKKNPGSGWYDYEAYKWANVVLVSNPGTYNNAAVGTIVNESHILAYLVWIPRFSYTVFNVNADGETSVSEQLINVTLQTINDEVYTGTTNGTELTHPAFWWDRNDNDIREAGEEINGFWIGKFELTGSQTTPTIKPNLASIRRQSVSSLWTAVEKFKTNAYYGISASNLDSHMIKNMEWGAVAYLSNSIYGNRNNPVTDNEIFINPSGGYITGRSGITVSQSSTADVSGTSSATLYGWNGKQCDTKTSYDCTGAIQTTYGMVASTTGNIYGVYDMNGGTSEYVMANMASSNSNYLTHTMYPSSAGVTYGSYSDATLPKRYYESYDYGTTVTDDVAYMRGKLGDATREIGASGGLGWNGDQIVFPDSARPWFTRGSNNNGTGWAGIWMAGTYTGAADSLHSSRAVFVEQ